MIRASPPPRDDLPSRGWQGSRDGSCPPPLGPPKPQGAPGASQRRSGATIYELSDRLGTVSRQTNPSAATLATRTYDAFGSPVATTGAPFGPFGFAGTSGYQEDADSGLKLLRHRYYDASAGRFLTRDPIKSGRNWYAYCENNPLKHVDSDGQLPKIIETIIDTGKKALDWFNEKVRWGIGGVAKAVGTVLVVGLVASFFEGVYEGALGSSERRDSERMYDDAWKRGDIDDEEWKHLKDENAKSSIKDAGGVIARFWEMQKSFWRV